MLQRPRSRSRKTETCFSLRRTGSRWLPVCHSSNPNGKRGAGDYAGAAARAFGCLDVRLCNTTKLWPEVYRAFAALFSADTTFDLTACQAVFPDGCTNLPGRGGRLSFDECRRFAGADTFAAEGAFADLEVHGRIAAVTLLDDAGRTFSGAVAAACAGRMECRPGECPRRSKLIRVARNAATQEISTAARRIVHCLSNEKGRGNSPALL